MEFRKELILKKIRYTEMTEIFYKKRNQEPGVRKLFFFVINLQTYIESVVKDENFTLFPRNPSKHNIAEDIRDLPVEVTAGAILRSNNIDTQRPIRP